MWNWKESNPTLNAPLLEIKKRKTIHWIHIMLLSGPRMVMQILLRLQPLQPRGVLWNVNACQVHRWTSAQGGGERTPRRGAEWELGRAFGVDSRKVTSKLRLEWKTGEVRWVKGEQTETIPWLCLDSFHIQGRTQCTSFSVSQTHDPLPHPKHLQLLPESSGMKTVSGDLPTVPRLTLDHFSPLLPPDLSFFHYLSNKHNATTNKNLKSEKT